jgi:ADP-ribose pyrophosphatase YjhB (NUDIX family)
MATHPKPRVGCAIILRDSRDRILLGRRSKEPYFGAWVLPGGGVDPFESYSDTAIREAKEELGIEITVEGLFDVVEIINPPSEHRIVIYVNCRQLSGNIRPSSDISEAKYFDKNETWAIVRNGLTTPTVSSILCSVFKFDDGSQEAGMLRAAS